MHMSEGNRNEACMYITVSVGVGSVGVGGGRGEGILVEREVDEAEVVEYLPLKGSEVGCPLQTTDSLQHHHQRQGKTVTLASGVH